MEKKVMTIFGAILFASIILTSCGSGSAKDIDLQTLSTSCEHIDAVLKIREEVVEIKQKNHGKNWDELSEKTQSLLIELNQKENKIIEQNYKYKEKSDDYEDCDFADKLYKSSQSLPGYYSYL
jgi:major membrane immunogen (membrane-anchored lipoprotein)